MNPHLRDRFFQRYGVELTAEILVELVNLAKKSWTRGPDRAHPDRERVWVYWRGQEVHISWHRPSRTIFTFLPPRVRTAWSLPKRKRR